eukprot:1360944-Amorphochlora_amoeboformis.AAC.2
MEHHEPSVERQQTPPKTAGAYYIPHTAYYALDITHTTYYIIVNTIHTTPKPPSRSRQRISTTPLAQPDEFNTSIPNSQTDFC